MRGRRRPAAEEEEELAARAPRNHRLGTAINAYLSDQGLTTLAGFRVVLEAWPQLVGPDLAAHCRPRRIEERELVVETDQAAWSTELAFRSRVILDALRTLDGAPPLETLKVHVRGSFGVE